MIQTIRKRLQSIRPLLFLQILFTVFAFALMCVIAYYSMNNIMHGHLTQSTQNMLDYEQSQIEADLAAISAAMKEKPDLLGADLKAKLSTVRANLFIIQRDGSRGAHNLDYALEIMAKAAKDIKEIKAALK